MERRRRSNTNLLAKPVASAHSMGRNKALDRLVCMPDVHSSDAPQVASGKRHEATTTRGRELPRLLFTREESARILGMSLSHFQRHVQPYVRCVYSGSLRLYPPGELRRWIERQVDGTGVKG